MQSTSTFLTKAINILKENVQISLAVELCPCVREEDVTDQ